MSNRLDQEREKRLQPKRMAYGRQKIEELGYEVRAYGGNRLEFEYQGETIRFWPYSGWHSGATIKDGRGIVNLLKQIKNKTEKP